MDLIRSKLVEAKIKKIEMLREQVNMKFDKKIELLGMFSKKGGEHGGHGDLELGGHGGHEMFGGHGGHEMLGGHGGHGGFGGNVVMQPIDSFGSPLPGDSDSTFGGDSFIDNMLAQMDNHNTFGDGQMPHPGY